MSTTDPQPIPDSSGAVSPQTADMPAPDYTFGTPAAATLPSTRTLWTWALTTAVLVAAASAVSGEMFYDFYSPPRRANRDTVTFSRQKAESDARNTAVAFGFLGGALGLGLGLAGGLASRSLLRGILGGVVGALIGGGGAVALSYVLMPVFRKHLDPQAPAIELALLIHGAIWAAAGAGGGIGFGIGLGGLSNAFRCLLGGIIGGLLGTTVFELVWALVVSKDDFDDLIGPNWPSRLAPFFFVSVFVAIGVVVMATASARTRKSISPALT